MNVILEAFLNTLWQTAAVALLAWAALRWTPRVNAATREAVWWAVLGFVVLMPVLRGVPGERPAPREPWLASASARVPFESIPAPVADDSVRRDSTAQVVLPSGAWPTLFLALWCAFGIAQCARLAWSYLYLRRLKQRGQPPSPEQQTTFDAWMVRCGIRRPVRLLVSSGVPMPVAVGFQHPAVVLPEGLLADLTASELDHVLLHELAHIARRDDWTNLLARLAGAVLALHPVAAWTLRQIDRQRELACDDWVVAATGAARPYAASLARLFELCTSRRRALLASGIADGGSRLGDRIAMLLRRGRVFRPQASALRVSICAAVMLILVIAASRTPAWIAFAQAQAPVSHAEAEAIDKAPRTAVAGARNSLLAALVANGYGDISVDEIIALKVQGVSPDFIAGMSHTGWRKLLPRELIDLKIQGVRAEYIGDILALGFGPFTPREFIDFKVQGVPTELFRALKDAGFLRAGAREIIDAYIQGLSAGHLREARQYGPNLTLRQIMRMKQAGVL
jgi:beta-lactamase regulating signal transducer with metallopeptidase domain